MYWTLAWRYLEHSSGISHCGGSSEDSERGVDSCGGSRWVGGWVGGGHCAETRLVDILQQALQAWLQEDQNSLVKRL